MTGSIAVDNFELACGWARDERFLGGAVLAQGTWHDRSGPRIRLEDWIDLWVGLLGDIEPTTLAKFRYLVEFHILPQFQERELGSLTLPLLNEILIACEQDRAGKTPSGCVKPSSRGVFCPVGACWT